MRNVTVKTGEGKFGQSIHVGPHELTGDELPEVGGDDRGPDPFELVLAGLGTCTSMTIKVYADRKAWPLASVEVEVSGEKRDGSFLAKRSIRLVGDLTDEQRTRLLDIANKCPVHKMLTGKIEIESSLV
ncbi:OsmC family protein [Polyangium mundeleinium]|uniref:OsmC family protein n=1 Tax=Polyangium mundeleinium TaxID=2995306 RepID=A0ABT5ELY7_9BACT|nr:OsmC family protein [Polyangium mundeleinium]MDC0742203.1 OsmC family protein [Polyangium mundeleinium]